MNIPELWLKIKVLLDDVVADWGLIAIILLVGLGSFGLGRFSALEEVSPPIAIKVAGASDSAPAMPLGGQYVASKTGSVYYFPWCSGAEAIPAEKQQWFASEKSAQAAGFRPAKNCKGL